MKSISAQLITPDDPTLAGQNCLKEYLEKAEISSDSLTMDGYVSSDKS